jgi:fucose 4-O-acetylase-like acetyltransferase
MTTQQIILWSCVYLVELAAVVFFTRPTARRLLGALVGGAAAGLVALGAITLCVSVGWWQIPFASTPYFLLLFYFALSIWPAPVYLITWRLARRFGRRGLAVFVVGVAVIGPPRDYLIAARFPKWMVFAPGVLPVLADAVLSLWGTWSCALSPAPRTRTG